MPDDKPEPRREGDPDPPRDEGALGVLFFAAAASLALILGLVALIGYFALSRSPPLPPPAPIVLQP